MSKLIAVEIRNQKNKINVGLTELASNQQKLKEIQTKHQSSEPGSPKI